jgi:hypothetical protein
MELEFQQSQVSELWVDELNTLLGGVEQLRID